ncbi:MAG: hypothetical protein ACFFAZ_07425 [Promethearchaeota archaeon]
MVGEAAAVASRLSIYLLLLFTLLYISLRIRIRIEKKETQERFGEGNSEHMKNVPGLHVRLQDSGTYIDFPRGNE